MHDTSKFWHALVRNQHQRNKDANSGQGKSVPVLFNRLNRKRGLLLTNYSCKRVGVGQPLIISQWRRRRSVNKKLKNKNTWKNEPPGASNFTKLPPHEVTNYSCFTTSGSIIVISVSSQWVLLPSHQGIEKPHHLCDKQTHIRVTGSTKKDHETDRVEGSNKKRSREIYFRWVSQRVEGFSVLGHLRN